MQEQPLAHRVVAIPESRELDVFASLLERRGARVVRCPLVAILDAPDPAPVLDWLQAFASGAMTDLILLTGEGLRRLLACADRRDPALCSGVIAELARVRKITRGPKPARALRELGLKPDIAAGEPTTAGVIESLKPLDIHGRTVGVQLYGLEPNQPLVNFLSAAGAQVRTVAPYVYASDAEDSAVLALLNSMAAGEVDAIAFTSSSQVDRLFAVGSEELCRTALERTYVAAIGPIVAATLQRRNITVQLTPKDSFFMKPLTNALVEAFGSA
jgi:uroporphyrinogen-III synthase